MLCLACLTLTSGLLLDSAVAETIYKSVDADGNVTFSNIPPPAGVQTQQLDVPSGPTPAEQQQSIETEQNLETMSNEIPVETPATEQELPVVQPITEYQQDSDESEDNDEPVVVDEGYVDDPNRDERLRDGVDDVREATPLPAEAPRPAGRVR
jgi:hypothetical protein